MPLSIPASPLSDDLGRRRRALGRRLKVLRETQRQSQTDLAETAGLAPRTLMRLEQAQYWPRLDVVLRLCAALGVSPVELLGPPAPTNGPTLLTMSLLALCRSLPPAAARRMSRLFALIAELPPEATRGLRPPASHRARRNAP